MISLAYMTGEYPRATDTFIQREIAALRERGYSIQTFAARRPAAEQILDRAARLELGATHYLFPFNFVYMKLVHWALLLAHPRRYLTAMGLAIKTRPPGVVGAFRQMVYFCEAGLLAWEMRQRKIPHLHNHFSDSSCTVTMLAAAMGGFTFSFTVHGPADFVSPTFWRLDEKVRGAAFVNCISNYARDRVLELTGPDAKSKLHVIHCGVNPSEFEPATSHGDRLLFVGRLAEAKGLPTHLRALSQVRQSRPATLQIVGDGPERAALEKLSAELGLQDCVEFLGYRPPSDVRAILHDTDVFVMTSLAEGVPVVLMEAMAAGVAVVAPRIAGIPELVDDQQNGLLTPPGDADATAKAILKLLADAELRRRFGKAGRSKVEDQFNIRREAEKISAILKSHGISPSQSSVLSPQSCFLVSPCRNEADYLRRSMDSVLAQTVLPSLWVIVDDGSTDQTPAILAEYAAKYPFIKIVPRPDRGFRELGRGVIDAFYDGYNAVNAAEFEFFAKLDLDLELPPRYFEILLQKMASEPRLGTCSGKPHYVHPRTEKIVRETCGDEQSVGMVKFYRTTCFQQIGGFVHALMWDGIDGHRCRMLGWIAASFDEPELRFEHMRPMGSSDKSLWTGRKRHGEGQYFMGTGLAYILASCAYRLCQTPILLGSLAMIWGYLCSMFKHRGRYGDAEFREFLRGYQWDCLVKGKSRATEQINAQQAAAWPAGRESNRLRRTSEG
jgi:glycosyltransferase involved in cell wall biosynthesis